jgi:hypothetical protein
MHRSIIYARADIKRILRKMQAMKKATQAKEASDLADRLRMLNLIEYLAGAGAIPGQEASPPKNGEEYDIDLMDDEDVSFWSPPNESRQAE